MEMMAIMSPIKTQKKLIMEQELPHSMKDTKQAPQIILFYWKKTIMILDPYSRCWKAHFKIIQRREHVHTDQWASA